MEINAMVDNLCDYYEGFYKNAPIGFYTTSLEDGSICMANPACCEMLGFNNIDELQRSIRSTDLYSQEDREHFIQKMENEGCVTDFETQLTIPNGKKMWVLLSGCIEGKYIQGAVIDINENYAMRQELERYKQKSLAKARNIGAAIEQRIDDSFKTPSK